MLSPGMARRLSVYYAGNHSCARPWRGWAYEEGLCLDTASGGELAIALRAQVPGQNIALHGNNKSYDEIKRAIKHGVGRVVVDSIDELKLIADVHAELNAERAAAGQEPYPAVPVLIRITPGVHASTHESMLRRMKIKIWDVASAWNRASCRVRGR